MCKYSRFSIDKKIRLRLENQATCRKCGSRTDEAGSIRLAIYKGHVSDRVFGYCDRLEYNDPVVCPGCGARNDYILIPCVKDRMFSMDINQLLKQISASSTVILVNNLNVTINNVYEPVQEQIEQAQAHRWAGYSHPYDICECGVMTRDFASHIRQMAAMTA